MTAAPTFTVVIPLYNKGARVTATLASVAAQTFKDYEVVVVDDGSTDDGPAHVARAGGRVRLIRQANAGPGAARNRGIAEARGAWVAFLDADDRWAETHLATLARTIAAFPEIDVVASGFTRLAVLPEHAAKGEIPSPAVAGRGARFIDFFGEHDLVWTSATAVRTTVLATERFGDLWPGEDVDLWTRLALRHRIAVATERTAIYVQETGGIMDSQDAVDGLPIATQPVFATVAAILADPAHADRHASVVAFRNRLFLDYVRPALFNGQTALARTYLRALADGGGSAPLLYRLLARLPNRLTRVGSRTYGVAKRWLQQQ